MNPTVINLCDSDGNAAQLLVAPEVINLNMSGGANQTGIDAAPSDASYFTYTNEAGLSGEWTMAASATVTFSDDTSTKIRTFNAVAAAAPDFDAQMVAFLAWMEGE